MRETEADIRSAHSNGRPLREEHQPRRRWQGAIEIDARHVEEGSDETKEKLGTPRETRLTPGDDVSNF